MELAVQIAHGLAAAHDKGIVHRDLKPENLFVTRDGRVKILDFGLAKLTRDGSPDDDATLASGDTPAAGDGAATEAGAILGTVGYMSPEQVRGLPADQRSDIFSFGAVLYEMVAGRRAFARDTAAETLTAILKEDPPELAETHPSVPPALERVVRRCLEKSPDERFHSARDVAYAIDALSGSARPVRGGGHGAGRGAAQAARPRCSRPGSASRSSRSAWATCGGRAREPRRPTSAPTASRRSRWSRATRASPRGRPTARRSPTCAR